MYNQYFIVIHLDAATCINRSISRRHVTGNNVGYYKSILLFICNFVELRVCCRCSRISQDKAHLVHRHTRPLPGSQLPVMKLCTHFAHNQLHKKYYVYLIKMLISILPAQHNNKMTLHIIVFTYNMLTRLLLTIMVGVEKALVNQVNYGLHVAGGCYRKQT